MSKKNNSCVLYPEVNGESSKLYKELLKSVADRPLVNWIYASYVSSNMGDTMEQHNIKRNSQGEHSAMDVLKFIDWSTIQRDMSQLSTDEKVMGAVDNNGRRIDYTDAKEALDKANDFNNSHSGTVAIVEQHGNVYNIIGAEKNSTTYIYAHDVEKRLKIWEVYKQVFNSNGIDIENMPDEIKDVFSAYNYKLAEYLKDLQNRSIDYLYKKDALILFNLDPNSPQVQRLIASFGSIEDAAQAMDDINHGNGSYTNAQKTLLLRAVNHTKNMSGIDIEALVDQVNQMADDLLTQNPANAIKQTLHELNKKYNIGINEIHKVNTDIRSLSDAAIEAVYVLTRKVRGLEKQKGNNAEGKALEKTLKQLMFEISTKKYCSGILNFLNEASNQLANFDDILNNVSTTGTELEQAFAKAKALYKIESLKTQFYPLLNTLSDESLTIDERIDQVDIDNIRQSARNLKELFDKKTNVFKDATEETMTTIMTKIVGDFTPDGVAMRNAIKMASVDSSMFDYLYSMGRASNPIIAAMGTIIRDAQDTRNKALNEIAIRVRRAEHKLQEAKFTSEFMYEDEGHIISDIDWDLYEMTRKAHIKSLRKQGLKGFDLKEAVELWEENNTEEREVDEVSGRTERVPNYLYRKEFPDLEPAQQEYYDTMMQIKGEIGTLLPAYAQHHYLPPQIRRNMLDALSKGDIKKGVVNKFKDLYTIREDDTEYGSNGVIIDVQEYNAADSDFNNTPIREIPIFFVNRVEQGELLKDFSTGIQHLAGTAINYNTMNEVSEVVEFMGDLVKNQFSRNKTPNVDVIENAFIRTFKDLYSHATNANTKAIVDGFISQHIYGETKGKVNHPRLLKLWENVLGYTSFKNLSTNFKGMVSNYLVGEYQMFVEAGAGEFYGFGDYLWAHTKLIGGSGVAGDMAELLTNNVNHKAVLFREMFDPIDEDFTNKMHQRYHHSMFRQLLSHDCSFIGYKAGEYLIHYINMYSVMHHTKVLLNGEKINLYDAFEVTNKEDGNSELKLKAGVTTLDGEPVTPEWLDNVRKTIRYVNQTTHGAMNTEDKGLIHQRWWGRGIMNFRQWMVESYSRRFRKRHFDATLKTNREGYWTSFYYYMFNEDTKDKWKEGSIGKLNAVGSFIRDFIMFTFRAQSQWSNLDDMQKANVKRAHTEMMTYIALMLLGFALGEPEDHKRDFWRRFFIYQNKRLMLDIEASTPGIYIISSGLTILQSPMASVNTLNAWLYAFYGLTNGDLTTKIKSGPYKGWYKYWKNMLQYNVPFWKDIEQMKRMDEDDTIFKVFERTPSNR